MSDYGDVIMGKNQRIEELKTENAKLRKQLAEADEGLLSKGAGAYGACGFSDCRASTNRVDHSICPFCMAIAAAVQRAKEREGG